MVPTRLKSSRQKSNVSVSKTIKTTHASAKQADESKPGWTFLTNHAHVLILLSQDSSMVLREVALRIGITERAVQRIIADLEEDGFIEREKIGRRNHYQILEKRPLRHSIESHRSIGDLINLVLR